MKKYTFMDYKNSPYRVEIIEPEHADHDESDKAERENWRKRIWRQHLINNIQ